MIEIRRLDMNFLDVASTGVRARQNKHQPNLRTTLFYLHCPHPPLCGPSPVGEGI